MLQGCNDDISAGHLAWKTLTLLHENYFWRGVVEIVNCMSGVVLSVISKKCSSVKSSAALCSYQTVNPIDRVHVDILGPFPVSDTGNLYVVMLVDQFTKWVEVYIHCQIRQLNEWHG